MHTFGILTKWNDDRAFDFITDDGDGSEVFVHISAFPEMGPRPRLGERLSFEIELGPDGYRQSKYINFPDRLIGRRHKSRVPNHRTPLRFLATLALAIVVGIYVHAKYLRFSIPFKPTTAQPIIEESSVQYSCDGRTCCPQMSSCAEAMYFLRNCPDVKLDGDNDGVPCDGQWCARP